MLVLNSQIINPTATTMKYAVVTGANKGIGLEICRQLASQGISVFLTARNDTRGRQAVQYLKSDNVTFRQLDVLDSTSISSLVDFIASEVGKLDILVNNAGVNGLADTGPGRRSEYELAEECLQVNYYGTKRTTEALLPLLQLSDSPRIVNISSTMGTFGHRRSNVESFADIDQILKEFLNDMKEGSLGRKGWPASWSAYCVSKAAVTEYTRLLAAKYPTMLINSVCPGWVKTDLSNHSGPLTPEEGAKKPVRLALLPDGGPSGSFHC